MQALVIDDSRAMRKILGQMLREMNLAVAEAGNGREALACLEKTGPVDVALVDWNMPEMDGFEFIQAVRADPRYAGLRLMMVTTETEMTQVARALEAGANEYVMKPFTKDIIREKLQLLGVTAG